VSYITKKLIAMDLDGTITQHKSALSAVCRKVLEELTLRYRLFMVCAGGCERVYKQMGEFPLDIIGFYGMQYSTVMDGKLVIQEKHTEAVDREDILVRAEALRTEFGFDNYDGDCMEFHASGMLTFPILGTTASLEKKLLYDPDRKKRRKYFSRVQEVFDDYTVFIGGTSSFDIVPRPYNKLHAIDCYLRDSGLERVDVIYFGDDFGLGGNDSDIPGSGIEFVRIDDYREFPSIARRMFLE